MNKASKLTGITVAPGQGVGKAFFVGRAIEQPSRVTISRQDVGDQVMRFNEIRERARQDYRIYLTNSDGSTALDASILNIYEHILDDPAFIGQVVETISTKLYDLETSIRLVSNDFIKRFDSAGTSYFKERSSDMVEICEKLVSYINQDDGRAKSFLEPVVLIVSRMFTPSDILSYDKSKIAAVITASGGKTSHAAILARSYSIPVLSGIPNLNKHIHPGDQLFVDATKGEVYIRPTAATLNRHPKTSHTEEKLQELKAKWNRPAYTRDGIAISVLANVSLPEDAELANEYGADGIGLVRSEYLLTNRKSFPPSDIQTAYYSQILQTMGKKPTVIRLMDIGGDKVPDFFEMPAEYNPFMGWRAIRIFLERKDIFEAQLTSILRAGGNGPFSIMIPMVTTVTEWQEAREFIAKVAKEEGVPMPKCGVLFEVPLAVLEMNTFMKDIDFASIGTNDLIQYLSAADRNNAKVNYLYNPIEPAFLKIIKNAIKISNDHGKPLSICGEMAGNPFHTIMLIGMGLKRFSVVPRCIPVLKELISKTSFADAAESVSHIEAISTTTELNEWLHNLNKRVLGDLLPHLPFFADV